MGTLYLVPTPIGNIADITLRSIRVLFSVDVICCEDTRRTGILLDKLVTEFSPNPEEKRKAQLLSYYDQVEVQKIPYIINLLINGKDIALVSDAGTPAISDPGFKLIRECIKENIKIVSLPGASSVLTALTVSGLPTDKFLFAGYPPHKPGHRISFMQNIQQSILSLNTTIILFEAPHKIIKTLTDLQSVFGDIQIVVCRELTKVFEEIRRETISESLTHFTKKQPKGEFVLLFHVDKKEKE